jgi:uncharacterized protein
MPDVQSSQSVRATVNKVNARGLRGRKIAAYYWRRLLRVRATPHEIALGGAAGVFAACTPFLGFQMALAAGLAVLLRVSVPAALLGTFIGNPLSWPAIWSASYIAGAYILGSNPSIAADQLADGASAFRATIEAPGVSLIENVAVNLSPLWEPLLLGGLFVGLLAAIISYYPTRRAVRVFQMRRTAG